MISLVAYMVFFLSVFSFSVAQWVSTHLLVFTSVFMAAIVLVMYTTSVFAIRPLSVRREHQSYAVEGQTVVVELSVENRSRLNRYAINSVDEIRSNFPTEYHSAFAFLVPARGQVSAKYSFTPTKRGVYRIGPSRIYGGDPFGFFKFSRKVSEESLLTVFPTPLPVKLPRLESASFRMKEEMMTVPVPGQSIEFLGIKEYSPGDSFKRVHWRSTARLNQLITKKFETNVASAVSLAIILDRRMRTGSMFHNPLEYAVKFIATFAKYAYERQVDCNFLSVDQSEIRLVKGTGRPFFRRLGRVLAELEAENDVDILDKVKILQKSLPQRSNLVLFIGEFAPRFSGVLEKLSLSFNKMIVVDSYLESFRVGRRGEIQRVHFHPGYIRYTLSNQDDLKEAFEKLMRIGYLFE